MKRIMNDKTHDAAKDLKKEIKNQEKMKIILEEEITDKMKRKKMYKNLRRIRGEEAARIQIKNKKKIDFMIGKYGKKE